MLLTGTVNAEEAFTDRNSPEISAERFFSMGFGERIPIVSPEWIAFLVRSKSGVIGASGRGIYETSRARFECAVCDFHRAHDVYPKHVRALIRIR